MWHVSHVRQFLKRAEIVPFMCLFIMHTLLNVKMAICSHAQIIRFLNSYHCMPSLNKIPFVYVPIK